MEEVLQRLETQLEVMSDQEEPTDTATSTTEARGSYSRKRRDTEALLNMKEALKTFKKQLEDRKQNEDAENSSTVRGNATKSCRSDFRQRLYRGAMAGIEEALERLGKTAAGNETPAEGARRQQHRQEKRDGDQLG